jgi:hypothetical protein
MAKRSYLGDANSLPGSEEKDKCALKFFKRFIISYLD